MDIVEWILLDMVIFFWDVVGGFWWDNDIASQQFGPVYGCVKYRKLGYSSNGKDADQPGDSSNGYPTFRQTQYSLEKDESTRMCDGGKGSKRYRILDMTSEHAFLGWLLDTATPEKIEQLNPTQKSRSYFSIFLGVNMYRYLIPPLKNAPTGAWLRLRFEWVQNLPEQSFQAVRVEQIGPRRGCSFWI